MKFILLVTILKVDLFFDNIYSYYNQAALYLRANDKYTNIYATY